MPSAFHRITRSITRSPFEAFVAVAAVAVAVYAVAQPFTVARYPAMTDFPFHAALTGTLRHWFDPAFHQQEQFIVRPLAVPYFSMYAIGAALMLVFPPVVAAKMAAFSMLILLPAGLAVMFHGMKKSPLLGLLGLGAVWTNLTHWGFLNFMGALGLFAMAIGLTFMVVDKPTRGRQWALTITLVCLFFTHIFRYPFALCGVVGTAIVMYPVTRRFRPIVAPMIPAIALMLVWLRVRPTTLAAGIGPLEIHKDRFDEMQSFLVDGFFDPAEHQAFERFLQIGLVVAGISFVFQGIAVFRARHRLHIGRDLSWSAFAFLVPLSCAAVFLLLYLVLPMSIGTWWYVYPREATAACFLLLGVVPDLPRPLALRAPLAGALAVAALGITAVVSKNYALFDRATDDFAVIIKQIPIGPKLMYLVFDHSGSTRTTTPFIHLPAYVQAEKGGWLSFHFATWGTAPIQYRSPDEPGAVLAPPAPERWEWRPDLFDVTRDGPFFDLFLVRNRTAPDYLFKADPTIHRVDHQGTWWLYSRGKAATN